MDGIKIYKRAPVKFKTKIIEKDAFEKDERKQLNFGHTVGHAFESYYITKGEECLHGFCVARGILIELAMSVRFAGLPEEKKFKIESYIKKEFGNYLPPLFDMEKLLALMLDDKKNVNSSLGFVLMEDLGKPVFTEVMMSRKFFADTLSKISH